MPALDILVNSSPILIKGLKKRSKPAGSVVYSNENQVSSFRYINHSSDEAF